MHFCKPVLIVTNIKEFKNIYQFILYIYEFFEIFESDKKISM